jgi:DinB superfamily
MDREAALRDHLARMLAWQDAHGTFESAVGGIPAAHRGRIPEGLPYSPWQLLEHLRITQHDILDFCRNPNYVELHWPGDYWPKSAAPPSESAWDESVRRFHEDRAGMQALAADRSVDLLATVPHGDGQTYLREILLVADHTSYHVGQLVAVRRLLGIWS